MTIAPESSAPPDRVRRDTPRPRVARITLARPDKRNAQDTHLLFALNAAFDDAARDDAVSVIVLAADGPDFSAGHDLHEADPMGALKGHDRVGTWGGLDSPGAEAGMAFEHEVYADLAERWRNLPKPTIAAVQGRAIAGGLSLAWPCDLIVAADDATFVDNTVTMGVCGGEFFHHPWEVGVRKAKEMLFTADAIDADEARALGMVNRVVPRERLEAETLDLAERIAAQPLFALKTAKQAVNAAQDAQGRQSAMQTAFALHQLCHSHNQQVHGQLVDPGFTLPGGSRS